MKETITIFKSITDTSNPFFVSIEGALGRIRSGKSKATVTALRACLDKKEREKIKNTLPAVCFSGELSHRSEAGLKHHSGYIILDFDKLEDLQSIYKQLCADQHMQAVWLSPSGSGLKALVKISDPTKHRLHFAALKKDYPLMDESGKDVSRVCYESYDPDMYINPAVVTYTKTLEVKYENTKVQATTVVTEVKDIYTKLRTWLESKQGCVFAKGNRNNYIMRLAAACNRFGLHQSDTASLIQQDFLNHDGDFTQKEIERAITGVYTRFKSSFGQSVFEDTRMVDKTTRKEVAGEELDMDDEPKDIIYLNDVRADMEHDFLHGTSKGETTYFESIDPHFRWSRGEVTLLSGHGNYGKTEMECQLTLIKSVKEGKKWGMFCPENYPPINFYKQLIRTFTGRSVDGWDPDRMSLEEYRHGMDFIQEHFYFIYPKNNAPTPEYIMDRFMELIIKKKIDGCIIDPFNQLENGWEKNKRDDHYIGDILSKFNRFARDNNVYFHILAHPKGSFIKAKDGNYPCPDVYDLSGGGIWNAKCDNIIMYHRPNYQVDKNDTACVFKSVKIKKQSLNGIPGEVNLDYNRRVGRYYENGYSPFDTKKESAVQQTYTDFTTPIKESDYEELPF